MQSQWRQDFGLLRKERSRVRRRLIKTNYNESAQFAYPKVPTTTRFFAIAYPRVTKGLFCKDNKRLCMQDLFFGWLG